MAGVAKKIFKGTAALSLSANIQTLISLLVFYILVTELQIADYGVLVLLFTVPGIVLGIAGLGLIELIQSEIALARGVGDFKKIKGLIKGYLGLSLFLFTLVVVVSFYLKSYFVEDYSFISVFYYPLVLFVFGQYFVNFFINLLKSFEEFAKVAIIEVVEPLFRAFALVVMLFTVGINLENAFVVYILSKWVAILFGIILSAGTTINIYRSGTITQNEIQYLIKRHGKWMILRNMIDQLIANAPAWLVNHFLTTSEVALYGVARKIFSIFSKVLPVQSVIFPIISKNIHNDKIISFIIQKARKYYMIFSISIIIAVWLLIDWAIIVVIPEYFAVSLLVKIIFLKLILDAIGLGQKSILFAHRKQKFQFFLFLYGAVQRIILLIIFIYYWGLVGLVISTLIHTSILIMIKRIYIQRNSWIKFDLLNYFKFDSYDKLILKKIYLRFRNLFFCKNYDY